MDRNLTLHWHLLWSLWYVVPRTSEPIVGEIEPIEENSVAKIMPKRLSNWVDTYVFRCRSVSTCALHNGQIYRFMEFFEAFCLFLSSRERVFVGWLALKYCTYDNPLGFPSYSIRASAIRYIICPSFVSGSKIYILNTLWMRWQYRTILACCIPSGANTEPTREKRAGRIKRRILNILVTIKL